MISSLKLCLLFHVENAQANQTPVKSLSMTPLKYDKISKELTRTNYILDAVIAVYDIDTFM